jgi:hypothetical protein
MHDIIYDPLMKGIKFEQRLDYYKLMQNYWGGGEFTKIVTVTIFLTSLSDLRLQLIPVM